MTVLLEQQNHDVLFDVIIIGTGLAGLRAAHELINKHGLKREQILLIDAQDYIGGRVRQADDFVSNGLIELGAEILHGELTLLTEFAREQGEEIKPIYCWAHGDGGPMEEPVDGAYGLYYLADSQRLLRFDTNDREFQHLNEVLRLLPGLQPDEIESNVSLEDFLKEHKVSGEMLRLGRAGYANTSCSNLNSLSLKQVVTFSRQWDTEGEGDGDFKYTKTFKCLMDFFKLHLSDRCLLNCPIQTISRDTVSEQVTLTSTKGQVFHAKRVIVTSSIHVLQRPELLSFEPPLPSHYYETIQEQAVMHRAMKIFLQFSAAFWPVGLQGMIMAPPAEEEESNIKEDKDRAPFYHIPECWFNAIPCAKHAACYEAAASIDERFHVAGGCPDCSFYCVGFVTSKFADNLDTISDDSEICNVMVQQLDKVFQLLSPDHWLSPEQHRLQLQETKRLTEELTPRVEDVQANVFPPTPPSDNSHSSSSTPSTSTSSDSGFDSEIDTIEEEKAVSTKALPLPSNIFVKGRVQRWTPGRHPYIGGGYASANVSQPKQNTHGLDYARIYGEKGVDNLVFFAGEGVNYPAGGTAHAALESGVRVAELIKNSFQVRVADEEAVSSLLLSEKLQLNNEPQLVSGTATNK